MRVAITGGIADGKSTVLDILAKKGFQTESSDEIARRLFSDVSVQAEICSIFGEINSDRAAIRDLIAQDVAARTALNRIMHPKIIEELRRSEAVFFEVPLLIESCLIGEFDRIWVVFSGTENQLDRLISRLGDRSKALLMLETQLPTPCKLAFADRILRNDQDLPTVIANVSNAIRSEFG